VATALRQQHAELVGLMLNDGCTDVEVDQHLQNVDGNIPGLRGRLSGFGTFCIFVTTAAVFILQLGQLGGAQSRPCTRTPHECATLFFDTVALAYPAHIGA